MTVLKSPNPNYEKLGQFHLLASVYAANSGLGNEVYSLGNTDERNQTFSPRRLLSGIYSLSEISWDSVKIFWDLSDSTLELGTKLEKELKRIFPLASISFGCLETAQQWRQALYEYEPESAVLIHANHDHALLPGKSAALIETANKVMGKEPSEKFAMITHFPEQVARLAIPTASLKTMRKNISGLLGATSSWGTVVTNAGFARTWWLGERIQKIKITRPDNPFGAGVRFEETDLIVPDTEIMRHLDGYGHVGLFEPVTPLRNIYDENFFPREWTHVFWPSRTFATHSTSADLLKTYSENPTSSFGNRVRMGIARLEVAWSIRVYFAGAARIVNSPSNLGALAASLAIICSLLSPKIVIGILSKFVEVAFMFALLFIPAESRKARPFFNDVYTLGLLGAVRKKFSWDAPIS